MFARKVLVVFGATGTQGGSLIADVLADASLSTQFSIRAITRDTTSSKALALASTPSVDVVTADILDPSSLAPALSDAHTVFIATPPFLPPATEIQCVKDIADAAVRQGASYIIYSSLPSPRALSAGKYTHVAFFDAKAEAETYIRGLDVKSAFVALGSFMENFGDRASFWVPRMEEGVWKVKLHVGSGTMVPLVHAGRDTGKFVAAILREPDAFEGRTVCAAQRMYSVSDIISNMARSSGREISFEKVPEQKMRESLKMPEGFKDMFMGMLSFWEEFGYFGPDGEEGVKRAAGALEGLGGLEGYFDEWPLGLE